MQSRVSQRRVVYKKFSIYISLCKNINDFITHCTMLKKNKSPLSAVSIAYMSRDKHTHRQMASADCWLHQLVRLILIVRSVWHFLRFIIIRQREGFVRIGRNKCAFTRSVNRGGNDLFAAFHSPSLSLWRAPLPIGHNRCIDPIYRPPACCFMQLAYKYKVRGYVGSVIRTILTLKKILFFNSLAIIS